MDREEAKQKAHYRKVKKALKSYRLRFLKNFFIWFMGVICLPIVLVLTMFVGLKVVPIGKITQGSESQYVSEDIAKLSIIDAFMHINDYELDDFPIIEKTVNDLLATQVMEGKTVNDLVKIKWDKLEGVKLVQLGTVIQQAIEVTAKIDDFVNKEDLKAFGELELFDWTSVKEADLPVLENGAIVDTEKYAPGVYYYQVSEGVYAPAFDSENRLVDGVSESQLVYANLFELPVLDVIEIFDKCIGRLEVVGLINALGNANIQEGDLIYDVLGGTTISSLGDIEEKLMNVRLDSVLPVYKEVDGTVTDNRQLYEILLSVVGKDYTEDTLIDVARAFTLGDVNGEFNIEGIKLSILKLDPQVMDMLCDFFSTDDKTLTPDTITIADIMGEINFGAITLDTVMPLVNDGSSSDNSEMYKMLLDAIGATYTDATFEEVAKALTVDDLTDLDVNNIKLGSFAPESMLDILVEGINGNRKAKDADDVNYPDYQLVLVNNDTIDLGDVADFTIDGVSLETVLLRSQNSSLYNILDKVIDKGSDGVINLSDLKTFNIENLTLSTAMTGMEGSDIANILEQATGESWSNITIAHIKGTVGKGFDIGKVKLSTVMGNSVDSMLENILLGACSDVTDFDDITINHLKATNGFNIKKVELSTVLGTLDNTLKQVLTQALNDTDGTLTIGDFDRGFNMNNVQLATVMQKGENNILNAILDKPGVTIGTLGQTINDLTLYELYGEECFTTNPSEAVDTSVKFRLDTSVSTHKMYVHDDVNGTYYLHKNDGIWLLLCFDFEDVNETTGRPEHYVLSNLKLSDLSNASTLSAKFTGATIAQLVDAGLLSGVNTKLYPYTLAEALNLVP